MKKGSCFFALLFVLLVTASAWAYTPGVYTATAKGNNADVPVKVQVTFDAEKITAVEVVQHDETPGLGDKAFEKIIPDIIAKQTADVDGFTGATYSSNAIREAVKDCIAQASGTKPAEDVTTFKPGTYTATVTGHNGPLTVTMTFTEDKITSLETQNVESPGIGISAIEILTGEILNNQSLACDSISGATVTSGAFLSAVRDCVKQSGITLSVLEAREIAYPKKSDTPIEMTADVIIVGAGGAGFAAATEALENGATVIILEKNEMIGGNTARAGGTLNAPDPERQSKIGVEDSVEKFFMNTLEAGDYKADPALVAVLASNALDARHWLEKHGTQWTEMVYQTIGGLWPRSLDEKDKIAFNGFVAPLAKAVAELGGKVILNCKAEKLIKNDSGKVVGVEAFDTKNGQQYIFSANNAVILATGGYAASAALVKKYNGLSGLPTSNAPTSTGDGITMGVAAGADTYGLEYVQIHPHGNPMTGGLQSHFAGVIKNSIYVNKEGKRFVEESGRRDVISNATIAQTGQIMFSIFDSEGGFYAGVKVLPEVELNNLKSKRYLYQADTLEDLAKQAGIDPDGLKATVARYNELVAAGKDTDFNKDEVELPISKAPFYCVPLSPTLHHTMGGLRINTSAQVINTDGQPIPGLYAAGEVTGGLHGSNRVGGNALTDGVVFGRIAGRNAANNK